MYFEIKDNEIISNIKMKPLLKYEDLAYISVTYIAIYNSYPQTFSYNELFLKYNEKDIMDKLNKLYTLGVKLFISYKGLHYFIDDKVTEVTSMNKLHTQNYDELVNSNLFKLYEVI